MRLCSLQIIMQPTYSNPDLLCCCHSYKFDTPFERELKEEVFKIVRRGREFGTPGYFFRAICYVSLFFYLQYCWVKETSYTLAIIYGVSMALIGLNVQHDANHGAASRKVWINDILGLGADFIGGSKWLWMEKHWTVRIGCMIHSLNSKTIVSNLHHVSDISHSITHTPTTRIRILMDLPPNPSFFSMLTNL